MSKQKSPREVAAKALEAAATEKQKAEQAVVDADREFEHGARSQEEYQRTRAARGELAFHARVYELAVAAYAEAEREETDRLAAEAEAQRLEQLGAVEDDIAKNIAASIAAGEALARGLRTGWDLAVASQGLGGTGSNSWSYAVNEALGRALVAEGFPPGAIRVT
jgi:hypothetical protein